MNNKKIIFQVTKTYMKKNKRRTLITFTGILVMVILMIADIPQLSLLTQIVMWVALALTLISLADYLWKNKGVLHD